LNKQLNFRRAFPKNSTTFVVLEQWTMSMNSSHHSKLQCSECVNRSIESPYWSVLYTIR